MVNMSWHENACLNGSRLFQTILKSIFPKPIANQSGHLSHSTPRTHRQWWLRNHSPRSRKGSGMAGSRCSYTILLKLGTIQVNFPDATTWYVRNSNEDGTHGFSCMKSYHFQKVNKSFSVQFPAAQLPAYHPALRCFSSETALPVGF